jgi:cell division protein FtsZ
MKELGRHINDQTQIIFGTAVDGRMGNRLSVTLISALDAEAEAEPKQISTMPVAAAPPMPEASPVWEPHADPELSVPPEPALPIVDLAADPENLIQFEEPPAPTPQEIPRHEPEIVKAESPARLIVPKKKPVAPKEPKPAVHKIEAKQEVMQFEPITRGRFEKSEPTIVEGQDLDVPTFLRKNIRVK